MGKQENDVRFGGSRDYIRLLALLSFCIVGALKLLWWVCAWARVCVGTTLPQKGCALDLSRLKKIKEGIYIGSEDLLEAREKMSSPCRQQKAVGKS